MELARLTLSELLAVAGAAGTIVVLLHLLRVRRRQVVVPFLPLWETLIKSRASSRLFARLSLLASLLVSLLVAWLLSLTLGEPRMSGRQAGRARVIVIDTGLSMQATDVAPSRLAAALAFARTLTRETAETQPTMIVRADHEATPLAPFSTDAARTSPLLDAVTASDLPTRIDAGYALGIDALARRGGGDLFVLSDRPDPSDRELLARAEQSRVRVHRHAFGKRNDNVAITAFAARRYPLDRDRSQILLELHNGSEHPERVELTVLAGGEAIDVQTLALAPGAREERIYDDQSGRGALLEARIRSLEPGHDDLAADNRAFATLPAHRKLRILCVTAGNRYLEAALLLDERFRVELALPSAQVNESAYDLIIYDRAFPQAAPSRPALYLGASAPPGTVQHGMLERPSFESTSRDHPVLRNVVLRDVNIARAAKLELAAGDVALARSGNSPLLAVGERERIPFLLLAFDVHQSDLPLRIAFPVLLVNAIDYLSDSELTDPPIAADLRPKSPIDLRPGKSANPLMPRRASALDAPLWVLLATGAVLLLLLEFWAYHRRLL